MNGVHFFGEEREREPERVNLGNEKKNGIFGHEASEKLCCSFCAKKYTSTIINL